MVNAPPWLTLDQIEREAQQVLNHDSGSHQPPIDPVRIAQNLGLKVFAATFSDPGVAGALQYDNGVATVYFNSSDPRTRQRFTVAHELGHYFLHREQGDFEDHESDLQIIYRWAGGGGMDTEAARARRRREFQANAFAAALLMPRDLVQSVLSDTEDLGDLARVFGVSRSAIGYRITSLESLV